MQCKRFRLQETNPDKWKVEKIWYNNQVYKFDEFVTQYKVRMAGIPYLLLKHINCLCFLDIKSL